VKSHDLADELLGRAQNPMNVKEMLLRRIQVVFVQNLNFLNLFQF
jgi:hypothetical protein